MERFVWPLTKNNVAIRSSQVSEPYHNHAAKYEASY